MNLLIIGAPGTGKGTMSSLLTADFNIKHISTGDMLRQAIRENTPVGIEAKKYMDGGNLVPDSIIHDIIIERLGNEDKDVSFLFDGYPRTVPQAEDLDHILHSFNRKLDAVIALDIAEESLVKRITGRRLCRNCSTIYNLYFKPTKVAGICDECGGELFQRKDDSTESLSVRLQEYHRNTEGVLKYYQDKGLVHYFNADQSADQVYAEIKAYLEGIE